MDYGPQYPLSLPFTYSGTKFLISPITLLMVAIVQNRQQECPWDLNPLNRVIAAICRRLEIAQEDPLSPERLLRLAEAQIDHAFGIKELSLMEVRDLVDHLKARVMFFNKLLKNGTASRWGFDAQDWVVNNAIVDWIKGYDQTFECSEAFRCFSERKRIPEAYKNDLLGIREAAHKP